MTAQQLKNHLREIQDTIWDPNKAVALRAAIEIYLQPNASTHPAAAVLAEKLDKLISPYIGEGKSPSEEKLLIIANTLAKLHEVLTVNVTSQDILRQDETVSPHTLLVALRNKELADEIKQQVKYFSYHCILCQSLNDILEKANQHEKLGAIILDTAYCDLSQTTPLKEISEKIPIIFISNQEDIATRLFAVKSGAKAFFVTPIEFSTLVETIDQAVTPPSETLPYRILIVEDSKTQANIIRNNLEQAGMIAQILTDPLQIMDVLSEFQPDLILLDLYMPQCSGIELAKVIRQQDPFVGIPIVFLSAEDDTDKQLIAISGGGDDFLTKPIAPHHLISAVIARAVRARALRSEMSQDSLTGLLNHTRILEQLDLEIARAKRNNTPLSFAMIDIDHFKAINDSHGHPVGDRVIKGLARLLKQRLRKTDSIGRYGGEEFAIIFPQSDAASVLKKLDDVRRGFSKLLHRSADPLIEFSATFSVGVAERSLKLDTLDKLVNAADKALYTAKEEGRNKVIFYDKG